MWFKASIESTSLVGISVSAFLASSVSSITTSQKVLHMHYASENFAGMVCPVTAIRPEVD